MRPLDSVLAFGGRSKEFNAQEARGKGNWRDYEGLCAPARERNAKGQIEVPAGSGFSPASGAIYLVKVLMCWVYVLQNPGGKFYVGHTDDLTLRLRSHNRTDRSLGKFTRKYGPWVLVWSEEHPDRASAMARERFIKSMKSAHWIQKSCSMLESRSLGINRRVALPLEPIPIVDPRGFGINR